MADLFEDLELRGLVHQVSDPDLAQVLAGGRLTAYVGFDPTADSLHVGHLLQVCLVRRLAEAGHRTLLVVGGATGLIGDPGGKAEERALLAQEQVAENAAAVGRQLATLVELEREQGTLAGSEVLGDGASHSSRRTLLLDNVSWLGSLTAVSFLRDVGKHFSVNQMIAKESVRQRIERPERGISFTELSYMLLQAYDFLHLFDAYGCRLQVGASDQWGNITMGIDLIRRLRGERAWGMTTPLVLKADGTKFGKTERGTVWLDRKRTSPYQLYQFFLRSDDSVVGAYLRYFTWLSMEEIVELDAARASRPERREAQRALARSVCTLVHGAAETDAAERAAAALFSAELAGLDEVTLLDVFSDAPSARIDRAQVAASELGILDVLVQAGLVRSRSEARRTVLQGGAYINNRREQDPERSIGLADLLHDRYMVLRKGKKEHCLVRVDG